MLCNWASDQLLNSGGEVCRMHLPLPTSPNLTFLANQNDHGQFILTIHFCYLRAWVCQKQERQAPVVGRVQERSNAWNSSVIWRIFWSGQSSLINHGNVQPGIPVPSIHAD